MNMPYLITMPVEDGEVPDSSGKVRIYASKNSQVHPTLSHYCSMDTLNAILTNRTVRCTRLNNASLNDQFEAKRKNVEQFSGSSFIASFTHCLHEIVPFWMNYGGNDNTQKVMMVFSNFAKEMGNSFHLDYCLTDDKKRIIFDKNLLGSIVNANTFFNLSNPDVDMRSGMERISIFDIEYLQLNDPVFSTDYSSFASVSFGNANDQSLNLKRFDITCMGKHKTIHWGYEDETRIVVLLTPFEQNYFNYIDLRVKESIFSNLQIVMSPWSETGLEEEIHRIINNSGLPEPIKQTISIIPSELHGQIYVKP